MTTAQTVGFVAEAPFVGGAERSLIRLAGALDRDRYRPFVIVGHAGATLEELRAAGIDSVHVPLAQPDRKWPLPFAVSVLRIAVHLHRQRAALLHVNDAPAHPAAALAARLRRIPKLCHIRFTHSATGLRWSLKWGFERALFASEFAKHDAQRKCPELFLEPRCAIIPNGFASPLPPPESGLRQLRSVCGLDDCTAVVGFVGRLVESKGVADFLQMAAKVLARYPGCRFLIVGDDQRAATNYRAAMEALASDLDIATACRFVGFRDDVWDVLHLCDVVVMPSHLEPFGNVAVEAGAAARALVATEVGGIPEIVRDGETGVLVPPQDPSALAAAVLQLLADPARRAALGARALSHVRAHFSLAAQADAAMNLYDAMLAGRPSRSSDRARPD